MYNIRSFLVASATVFRASYAFDAHDMMITNDGSGDRWLKSDKASKGSKSKGSKSKGTSVGTPAPDPECGDVGGFPPCYECVTTFTKEIPNAIDCFAVTPGQACPGLTGPTIVKRSYDGLTNICKFFCDQPVSDFETCQEESEISVPEAPSIEIGTCFLDPVGVFFPAANEAQCDAFNSLSCFDSEFLCGSGVPSRAVWTDSDACFVFCFPRGAEVPCFDANCNDDAIPGECSDIDPSIAPPCAECVEVYHKPSIATEDECNEFAAVVSCNGVDEPIAYWDSTCYIACFDATECVLGIGVPGESGKGGKASKGGKAAKKAKGSKGSKGSGEKGEGEILPCPPDAPEVLGICVGVRTYDLAPGDCEDICASPDCWSDLCGGPAFDYRVELEPCSVFCYAVA